MDTLEPAQVRSGHEFNIVRHIFATLLEVTPDGELIPYLAESYEVSEAGTEITFTLREGLTCHDGEALTADDVVYSFERAADPENAFNGNTPGFIYDSLGYAGARRRRPSSDHPPGAVPAHRARTASSGAHPLPGRVRKPYAR